MPLIVMDESAGRVLARQFGLTVVGTLGVLVLAKDAGLVSEVVPLMNRLQTELRFFVSPQLRTTIRRLASE